MKQCQMCGKDLVYSGRGRPPSQYCSRKCKDSGSAQKARREALEQRKAEQQGERCCPVCGGTIPDSVTLRAICCSRECGVTYQNRKSAERRRAKRRVDRKPCAWCGGAIPDDLHAGALCCSKSCTRKRYADEHRQPGARNAYMRKYLYGITEEQYAALMEKQGNACAICGSTEWPGKGNRPNTDHCHTGGQVRGILCGKCNAGLGHFDDDPARLRVAAVYLEGP